MWKRLALSTGSPTTAPGCRVLIRASCIVLRVLD